MEHDHVDAKKELASASSNKNKNKKINNGGSYKAKADMATAKLSTDPQSVAARRRRHRISDRFKILQSMVPGGTKMDTASMLEEAINYVKFLKTVIWFHQNIVTNLADHHHRRDHDLDHQDHDLFATSFGQVPNAPAGGSDLAAASVVPQAFDYLEEFSGFQLGEVESEPLMQLDDGFLKYY